jgi:hypothetical protein
MADFWLFDALQPGKDAATEFYLEAMPAAPGG